MHRKSHRRSIRWPGTKGACRAITLLLLASGAVCVRGQEFEVPTPSARDGLRIRSVSGYAVYYSTGFQDVATNGNQFSDVGGGGSVQFSLSRYRERSSFDLSYTPSYTGRANYGVRNALNHSLSLTASRKLAPRWNLIFSLAGDLSTLDQSMFAPGSFIAVASAPVTFDDLSAALLTGRYNDARLTALLSSAPLADSPARNLLYGQRMFTAGMQTSVSYSYSPRFSVPTPGGGRS